MERPEIKQQLTTILTGEFAVPEDEISEDATFEELGLDSLDLVEVTMVIDEEIGVKIPDERLGDITTLGDAVDVVHELQAEDA